jgi:thioredoxin 1
MSVQEITSYNQFTSIVSQSQYVIIDFYANWCGPCKNIAPIFSQFSLQNQFSRIKFLKVNVDNVPEISQLCKVSSLPTFVTFKNGQIHNKITGANEQNILNVLNQLNQTK